MSADMGTEPQVQRAPDGAGTPSRWPDRSAFDDSDTLCGQLADPSQVVPQLAQGLVPLPESLARSTDAAAFAAASRPQQAMGPTPLDQLCVELRALVETGGAEVSETCSFHLEVPGLGRLDGRLAIRGGQARLELHSARQAVAAALRARQHELQRSVDSSSRGEVNLLIV